MTFDDKFFKEEIISGFTVSKKMKHAWAAQLEVLSDIDSFCNSFDIPYFAAFGTLLGAVRHHGFIPWDDDIDIMMKRKDCIRFCELAPKHMPYPYLVFNMHTEDFQRNDYYTRVTNGNKIRFDDAFLDKYHGFPYVVGIDIFPLDALPDDPALKDYQYSVISIMERLRRLVISNPAVIPSINDELSQIEDICNVTFIRDKSLEFTLLEEEEKLAMICIDDPDPATYSFPIGGWCAFPKEIFEDSIRMTFENTTIPVPAGYEKILPMMFGEDYMTPKQYFSHDYPFYKVQEEEVIQAGMKLPEW